MAKIVFGAGASHSPLLTIGPAVWASRAADDQNNGHLNLSDGRFVSYQQLAAEVGDRYAAQATVENFTAQSAAAQAALDRLADDLAAADPDVVVIVGDDHGEFFSPTNMPALSVYYGETAPTRPFDLTESSPEWMWAAAKNYGLDQVNHYPASPQLALAIINGLVTRGIDVGAASTTPDPKIAGFGHAFGFIVERLFKGRRIPIVPFVINTYFPPNPPLPWRCHDVGRALRAAIEECTADLRVAVIASGGLSHFTTDEVLDRTILDALRQGNAATLRDLPVAALNSGSSEIRNWVLVSGAVEQLRYDWDEYVPVYRTPAGTGCGLAFSTWKEPRG